MQLLDEPPNFFMIGIGLAIKNCFDSFRRLGYDDFILELTTLVPCLLCLIMLCLVIQLFPLLRFTSDWASYPW